MARLHFVETPMLKRFRRLMGEANYHLCTTIAGLETLWANEPVVPSEFVVAWRKPATDDDRLAARNFILQMMMVSAVDAVDQYMRGLQDFIPLDGMLGEALAGRLRLREGDRKRRATVGERFAIALRELTTAQPAYSASIELLAYWRNSFVHGDYRFELPSNVERTLRGEASYFSSTMNGTSVDAALDRYRARCAPLQTDVAMLIAAAHRAVNEIDQGYLRRQANGPDYAKKLFTAVIGATLKPTELIRFLWLPGGNKKFSRIEALFRENGGRSTRQATQMPVIERKDVAAIFSQRMHEAIEEYA